jgi:hypothetical protein
MLQRASSLPLLIGSRQALQISNPPVTRMFLPAARFLLLCARAGGVAGERGVDSVVVNSVDTAPEGGRLILNTLRGGLVARSLFGGALIGFIFMFSRRGRATSRMLQTRLDKNLVRPSISLRT